MQESDLKRSLFASLAALKDFCTSLLSTNSLYNYIYQRVQSEVCCGVSKTSEVPEEMSALKSLYGNTEHEGEIRAVVDSPGVSCGN